MIASSKQRQEHHYLATSHRSKLKGAHEEPPICKKHKTHMRTPTRMDKVVIEDYYHVTTMKETWIG